MARSLQHVAFVAGGLMPIDTELPGYGIPPVLIGTLAIASALLLAGTARLALAKAYKGELRR